MFKTALLLMLSLLTFQLAAQSAGVFDKMTESACDCASKKDFEKMDPSALQMELGLCIMSSLEFLPEKERAKINMTDKESMRKFGESIGLRMATKCPKALMAMAKASQSDDVKSDGADTPPPPPPPGKIEGTVKEVIEGEFVTVVISDKNQREQRLIWLAHFNGESNYTANPQLLKGKNVEVSYYNQDRYVAKMHDYITFKQILELKEKK